MFLWIAAALAGSLFINDVEVRPSDLAGLELDKVDVRFDAAGNVRIRAPGYKIEITPAPDPKPRSSNLSARRWWLLVEPLDARDAEVVVSVNERVVQRVRAGQPAALVPLDSVLRAGDNAVRVNTQTFGSGARGFFAVTVAAGEDESGLITLDASALRRTIAADAPDTQFSVDLSR